LAVAILIILELMGEWTYENEDESDS
jgi:hypothetical protein